MPFISVVGSAEDELSSSQLRFDVTLSEPAVDAVTVSYRLLTNGTAGDNDVFYETTDTRNNGTVSFAPGETSASILIFVKSDTTDESDEAVTLELFNPSANASFVGGVPVARTFGVINDNDGVGSNLAVFVSDPVIVEGDSAGQSAVFELRLSQPATESLTFGYKTADGSALAGQDYSATTGALTFVAGQEVAFVSVPVIGDAVSELSETFDLVVSPPSGVVVDTAGAAGTATLLDNDTVAAAVISVAGDAVQEATSSQLRFVVTLSEPAMDAVTVSYRLLNNGTAGDNDVFYGTTDTRNNGTVSFAPGQTSASIMVFAKSDTIDERDEAVTLELFEPTGNASFAGGLPVARAFGVINDDDGVGLNLSVFVGDPVLVEADSSGQMAVFEVRLSQPATAALTFGYQTVDGTARAGQDYTATTGAVTFAIGQDVAYVSVPVTGDIVSEISETFDLVVTPPSGVSVDTTGAAGTATLLDNDTDGAAVISIAGDAVQEATSNQLRFVVTLSEASVQPVTVDYQTLGGSAQDEDIFYSTTDARNNGTVTFAPGETTASILIFPKSDTADERDEAIFVQLSNPVGAAFAGGGISVAATGFILDDDGLGLNTMLEGAPTSIVEKIQTDSTSYIEVELSRPASGTLTFDVTATNGTATAGNDFSLLTSQITFLAGQDRAVVAVQVNDDAVLEVTETFSLNYAPIAGSSFAGTILAQSVSIVEAPNTAATGSVTISGSALEGKTLTASETLADVDGLGTLSYQWLRNGAEITGATAATYNLRSADAGSALSVRASFVDGQGKTEAMTSAATDTIVPIATPGADVIKMSQPGTLKSLGGDDVVTGTNGDDKIIAGGGNDTVKGRGGDDTVKGGGGNDKLIGGGANDTLKGGGGNDNLKGSGGQDLLSGAKGADKLKGGGGSDTFEFKSAKDSLNDSRDKILDFKANQNDVIDLSGIDAVKGKGNQDFTFIEDEAFSGEKGELRFEVFGKKLRVQGDTDGDGTADFAVDLLKVTSLTADDFVL